MQTLQLVFRNEENSLFTLSLTSPRTDLELPDVTTAMDTIISKNIFHTAGGDLVSKVRARIVTREVEEIISYI